MDNRKENKAYRYKDELYSGGNEEYGFHTYQNIILLEYNIIKETPKGIWIQQYLDGTKRFVNLNSRKKFACLTKQDAIISFRKRKERQIKLLESQLSFARQALTTAENIQKNL